MKRFAALVLAAVLGSVITIATTRWWNPASEGVKIQHINSVPTAQVGYRLNENGEAVALDFTGTAEKVTKAVVNIRSTSEGPAVSRNPNQDADPFQFFFGPNQRQRGPVQSSGSGVIINKDGYIVTNNHVVQNADVVDVTLTDNRTFKAEVIGTDPDTDLALIKINQKDLPFLSFVNSDQCKVGQWVLAVGNPFNLNSTVTAGIISAKGRSIGIINRENSSGEQGNVTTAIESFIQTDAAINPGNSGGALVDLDGGLVGINTAIASPTGAYSGYGFAIPANIVSKITEDLLAYGTVQRGWLGVQVRSVDSELSKEKGLSVSDGAYISEFAEKSSAKEAGLMAGDVVVKLDETPIKSSTALIEFIGQKRPGDKVKVLVNRDGKELTFTVTLKTRDGKVGTIAREEPNSVSSLGLQIEDADPKMLKKLDIPTGVYVKSVGNGRIARYTDMRDGFIITRVDDKAVKTAKEVNDILKSKKPGDLVTFSGVYEDFPREYIYAIRI
ncbi:MAG: Do family serine endopeptidase [Bacteroidetes bacterium]|nr:Do family serine endopeptidase [Bacteroidota bacterium]